MKRYLLLLLFSILLTIFVVVKSRGPHRVLPPSDSTVTLITVGDISYSREVGRQVRAHKDLNYPFLKVKDILKNGDITFANLESPVTPGREIADGEMVFRADPGTEKALKEARITLVSLANNHTPNFGEESLKNTFNYLKNAKVKYVGAGNNDSSAYHPAYLEAKGTKFAFLAYSDPALVPSNYEADEKRAGTAFMNVEKMMEEVGKAKKATDFVIVYMHSGAEYTQFPSSSQIKFAHAAIDAGADMVIGSHPHVVQTMEKYKDKYIFYSIGNFVFDQMWSYETRQGLILKITFDNKQLSKIRIIPVISEDYCQPNLAEGETAKTILQRLNYDLKDETIDIIQP
jgi:poly-gamma-glutamate capsule biosynthesis protein CapA/YwtB (metallophosphatase superfamily)